MPAIPRIASASPELEETAASSPLKRKRDGENEAAAEESAVSKRQQKRRKQKEKRKQRQAGFADEDDALDLELGINTSLRHMDPPLIADHIGRQTKKFNPDLTAIEAEEWRIPANVISDTTSYLKPHSTENMPDFLRSVKAPRPEAMDLSKAPYQKGAPHTLVLASAGLRAADLTRALRVFQSKDATIAKLFAKHIKLSEAIESAKTTRMGIGIGTPTRVADLLDSGALKAERLERVVVDFSHIDVKKRGVLDMRETLSALVKLLTRKDLSERFGTKEHGIDLIFY